MFSAWMTQLEDQQEAHHRDAPWRVAPGKRATTSLLPGRGARSESAGRSASRGDDAAVGGELAGLAADPFAVHLSDAEAQGRGAVGRQVRLREDVDVSTGAFEQATSSGSGALPYRREMEQAFGEDLSGVQVHLGQERALARMDAEAATQAGRIAFATDSPSRELVAHELVHVMQERRHSGAAAVQRKGRTVASADHAAEREADALAPLVAAGQRVTVQAAPDEGIHCALRNKKTLLKGRIPKGSVVEVVRQLKNEQVEIRFGNHVLIVKRDQLSDDGVAAAPAPAPTVQDSEAPALKAESKPGPSAAASAAACPVPEEDSSGVLAKAEALAKKIGQEVQIGRAFADPKDGTPATETKSASKHGPSEAASAAACPVPDEDLAKKPTAKKPTAKKSGQNVRGRRAFTAPPNGTPATELLLNKEFLQVLALFVCEGISNVSDLFDENGFHNPIRHQGGHRKELAKLGAASRLFYSVVANTIVHEIWYGPGSLDNNERRAFTRVVTDVNPLLGRIGPQHPYLGAPYDPGTAQQPGQLREGPCKALCGQLIGVLRTKKFPETFMVGVLAGVSGVLYVTTSGTVPVDFSQAVKEVFRGEIKIISKERKLAAIQEQKELATIEGEDVTGYKGKLRGSFRNHPKKSPGSTGEIAPAPPGTCAAPKLIEKCRKAGDVPKYLSEKYYTSLEEVRSKVRVLDRGEIREHGHGVTTPSCINCRRLTEAQLDGINEDHENAALAWGKYMRKWARANQALNEQAKLKREQREAQEQEHLYASALALLALPPRAPDNADYLDKDWDEIVAAIQETLGAICREMAGEEGASSDEEERAAKNDAAKRVAANAKIAALRQTIKALLAALADIDTDIDPDSPRGWQEMQVAQDKLMKSLGWC